MEAAKRIVDMYSTEEKREGKLPTLVALTADATREAERNCLASGFDAFLTKPVTIRDIEAVLNQYTQWHNDYTRRLT